MKLIIDINEEIYKKCKWKNNGVVGLEWWERAIANGTPIPDNEPLCENCPHVKVCGDLTRAWCKKERAEQLDDLIKTADKAVVGFKEE